jgi:hypothetical protein
MRRAQTSKMARTTERGITMHTFLATITALMLLAAVPAFAESATIAPYQLAQATGASSGGSANPTLGANSAGQAGHQLSAVDQGASGDTQDYSGWASAGGR